ncbi:ATP synthase F1 subunit delta [Croceimicrobium sp.]|uniref:ATP synthase F1 subunit delta n=1 Tax=Croceimicrobium sp. TaxID=2828340 RepID=UPI003BACA17E
MVVTKLGRVYAKALIDLAKEQDQVEAIREDMRLVSATLKESRDLANVMSSPIVKGDKKQAILQEIFKEKISDLSLRFLNIVVDHGREGSLRVIAQAFENMYLQHKGIEKVSVTTAYALSDDEVKAVTEKASAYTGKQVELAQNVDENIIGGMVLRVGDKRYNGSLAHQLETLRRQFKDNHYIKDF